MSRSFPGRVLYGADYNPEQWPQEVWQDDVRLMRLANVNMVSLNIFSWAMLEPSPHSYSFDQLDGIMDLLAHHGIAVDLATATASPPTWMSRLYPAMLPVTRDGRRLSHGSRQHYCPNSQDYRREAGALVIRLAERYASHPALALWHVNNEIGCHVSHCYCDRCAVAFRAWLRERYGSLEALNLAWGTDFWSQHYYEWEDILPPRLSPAQNNPGQSLDYQRCMSDSLLACYLNEAAILRRVTPHLPLTTNLIVAFKPADYFAWAPHLDVVAFDNYPALGTPPWEMALSHDLMRSLKKGEPHLVMEQTPSQLNWMPQNPHKRPGIIRLQSMQALAHGADGVMYFQWRQSPAGAEKFHSAIVSHAGGEHSRIFKQVARIGSELQKLTPAVAGSRISAQVAILMDWHNWWAVEYLPGPSDRLHYWEQLKFFYRSLHAINLAIDFVEPSGDLSAYRLIVAPLLYLLRPALAGKLERFVEQGGTLLTTFFSGIVDEHDHVVLGGYPAELRRLLGLHVEEFDPWTQDMTNAVVVADGSLRGSYPCTLWGEMLHLEGAQALATFASDYYAGGPALTVHSFGQGQAYYLATQVSADLMDRLMSLLCQQAGVAPLLEAPAGLEVTCRTRADGRALYFLLNHSAADVRVALPAGSFTALLSGAEVLAAVDVAAYDVVVLLGGA
jgi:beta-galactosidase